MEKLTEKLEEFNQAIIQRIIDLIATKGVKSEHTGDFVLRIQDEEQMYNIDGYPSGSYITEITPSGLVSNYGHTYGHDSISIENLCLVIDSIAEQPSKFRVGTMDSHGNGELYKYFDDEKDAYEHFIDQRADEDEVWMEKRSEEGIQHGEYETVHTYCADEDTIENA